MERLRCADCGEIIGVYEPMRLVLPDGTDRHGSTLTLGDQLNAPGSAPVHERCYESLEPRGPEGRGANGS